MDCHYKKVSEKEIVEFIKSYPRKLEINTVRICEPPMREWYDFTKPKNEQIVAYWIMDYENKDKYYIQTDNLCDPQSK